ncbi:unnamed protein product [Prorocentrum cordatum]|uniref:Cullin family profile domain-containing protein n=1 Tax=Prorocentrum cordatum TaxID=2364126 RepID=A0ABN9UBX7_9DINO|nr:unnamed protein product [Polarella glacialis]
MAAAPADAAWARAVGRLQSAVAGLEGAFGAAAAGAAAECSAQAFPGEVARLDLEIVQAAGDGALLEELAFELAARSLSACVVPCFWACVPGGAAGAASAESAELEPGWQERLRRAFAALLRLHLGHCELLRALGTPGAGRLVGAYRAAFRAELTESWPPWASERLRLYFGSTWRPFARSRARPGEQRYQSEEWWWAISSGDQATAPSRPPRRRVLELLEASRRPVRGGAPGCGQDAVMGDACPPGRWLAGDGEGSGGEEDEAMFSEADSDASSVDADAAVDDDPRQPTASSVEGLRGMAVSFQRMGLGDIWRDLAVQFAVDQLASTVEDCPVVAPRHLPAGEAEGGECPLRAEDAWWGAARHLVLQLFQAFADLRIGEAFDMLKEFPDSAPALTDLRRCLARTGRATLLVRSLREQLTRRLLIAGARTHDVIGVYVKTIRAMRLVDPRGLLLEAVSDPIRAYLKRRKDTVRCIITALTEDSDLLLELRAEVARAPTSGGVAGSAMGAAVAGAGAAAGSAVGPGEGTAGSAAHPVPAAVMPPLEPPEMSFGNADFDVSEDEEDPDAWTPDPIDADPLIPSRQRSVQDVISLLVGIYGSKEMFIKEYKEMLADRLLETSSYSTEREAHNLELLKTRFGETALGHCEVMLQDIKDSKRLNANVQQCTDLRPTTAPAVGSSAGAALRPPTRAEAASGTPAAGSRPPVAPFRLSSAIALAAAQDSPAGEAQASPPALGASRGGRAEELGGEKLQVRYRCRCEVALDQYLSPVGLGRS